MRLKKPIIAFTKYTPYHIIDLERFHNSKGEALETTPVTTLCRCGHSENKPYCDGIHSEIGFSGEKSLDRVPDRVDEYVGEAITIVDNRGVCAHRGACTDNLPRVFIPYDQRKNETMPWIEPDKASIKEIIETIEKCPSGALSYKIGKRRYQDLDQEPGITVTKDGPLDVMGGILLKDDEASKPECAEHYCLCRCGESFNKPFCDGTHWDIDFEDEDN